MRPRATRRRDRVAEKFRRRVVIVNRAVPAPQYGLGFRLRSKAVAQRKANGGEHVSIRRGSNDCYIRLLAAGNEHRHKHASLAANLTAREMKAVLIYPTHAGTWSGATRTEAALRLLSEHVPRSQSNAFGMAGRSCGVTRATWSIG
jgi:hypothetical protein